MNVNLASVPLTVLVEDLEGSYFFLLAQAIDEQLYPVIQVLAFAVSITTVNWFSGVPTEILASYKRPATP